MMLSMGSSTGARALDTASYTLTVSQDPRLLPTVYDLTAKTAELLGCHGRASVGITEAVQLIVEAIVGPDVHPSSAGLIDLQFDADPETLRIEVATEPPSKRRAGWSVEAVLVERQQLDALRALMPDVEFVTRGHRHICRLTCALSPRP
jgi:hypothetical protein